MQTEYNNLKIVWNAVYFELFLHFESIEKDSPIYLVISSTNETVHQVSSSDSFQHYIWNTSVLSHPV